MEHFITDLETLKEKTIMQVEVLYRNILLIYTDDQVYAIEDRCPHLGVTLATGKVEDSTIKCKDHGLAISLKNGEVISERQADYLRLDKKSRCIKTFSVKLSDNKIYIEIK